MSKCIIVVRAMLVHETDDAPLGDQKTESYARNLECSGAFSEAMFFLSKARAPY